MQTVQADFGELKRRYEVLQQKLAERAEVVAHLLRSLLRSNNARTIGELPPDVRQSLATLVTGFSKSTLDDDLEREGLELAQREADLLVYVTNNSAKA